MLSSSLRATRVFIISVSFLFSSLAIAVDLPNGGVISEEISVSGEIDEYTFTANAGDTVYLRIADTETTEFINASFFPRIDLVDPAGVALTYSFPANAETNSFATHAVTGISMP